MHQDAVAPDRDDEVDFEALRLGPAEDSPVLDFDSPLPAPRLAPSSDELGLIGPSVADVRAMTDDEVASLLSNYRSASDSARQQRTRAIGLEDRLADMELSLESALTRVDELMAERERAMAERVVLESRASAASAERTQVLLALADFHEVRTALSLATGMLEDLMPTDFRIAEFEALLSRVGESALAVQTGPRPSLLLPPMPRAPDSPSRPDTGVVVPFRRPGLVSPDVPVAPED